MTEQEKIEKVVVPFYQLGDDPLPEYDISEFGDELAEMKAVVYHYYHDTYDGGGQLVAISNDRKYYVKALDHCSCYGALNNWRDEVIVLTEEEFFALTTSESVHDLRIYEAIMDVVKNIFHGTLEMEPSQLVQVGGE